MTLSELANIGETLGGVAVLVSLIYLILRSKEVRRPLEVHLHGTPQSRLQSYAKASLITASYLH